MNNLKNFSILLMLIVFAPQLWAVENRDFVGAPRSNTNTATNSFRAACIEARAETDLNINNVRARLRSGGDLWWDGQRARYIVPNVDPASGQPLVSSLFAGAIWLGAFDDGGNLILAAQTYRQNGNDFWTGPLNTSTGTIEKADCEKWDRFFTVFGSEIDALRADYFEPDPSTGESDRTIDVRPARNLLGWPGRGNPYFAEIYNFELPDQDLAPFIEPQGFEDGIYDPYDGDHPVIEVVGCVPNYFNPVYADQMSWWVYNDNGNIHTNTNGQAMQMEIQGLAFGYRTTDAINNMTFYRYKLLNRNNLALNDTYFSLWSDPDLGCYTDDYIGVDTTTGMGYVYNADANDDATCGTDAVGYGTKIPALGVDYFRGPLDSAGNLIGLSSFTYTVNTNDPVRGNPGSAIQHYRLMSGLWLDGRPISRGGTGDNGPTAAKFPYVYYSFPNETGPDSWSMCSAALTPADYRFLHTSGPFVLKPGATNELISGVVWTPDIPDYPCPSLQELVKADVLAQNLFDDCFKITDGPDAPFIDIIELENELILNLSYVPSQNNYRLGYSESPARLRGFGGDSTYSFQGYKVYQVNSENISVTDLENPEKARMIFQVDLQDSVAKIVNWEPFADPDINAIIPTIMVEGENKGIKHTFQIKEDKFTLRNPKLVNHKSYYFCVVAYGHNEYQRYDAVANTGQATPYLQGRRNFRVYTGIPRPNSPEYSGMVLNSSYGDRPEVTRVDGKGNGGGLFLDFADMISAETEIINNGSLGRVTYAKGKGPIDVKVVDPLRVPTGKFQLYISDQFYDWVRDTTPSGVVLTPQPPTGRTVLSDSLFWILKEESDPTSFWSSYQPLTVNYEQYIPELGISMVVERISAPGAGGVSGYIGSSVEYADTTKKQWFVGIQDGASPNDYLKTGNSQADQSMDPSQDYSKLVEGWHPFMLAYTGYDAGEFVISTTQIVDGALGYGAIWRLNATNRANILNNLRNVNIVITADKTKWSRCIVTETANRHHSSAPPSGLGLTIPSGRTSMDWKRNLPGRDKDGNVDNDPAAVGRSWFPGYAYDVETGERLNVFFGENSFYNGAFFDNNIFPGSNTGNDMLFNPTNMRLANPPSGIPVFGAANLFLASVYGGQHAIYVSSTRYDSCQTIISKYIATPSAAQAGFFAFRDKTIIWSTMMHMEEGTSMLDNNLSPKTEGHVPPTDLTFKLRIKTPYQIFNATGDNNGYPLYEFDLTGLAPKKQEQSALESALDLMKVVPNPYYAYSEYEQTEIQNVVKVTNLPAKCTVSIFGLDGRLVREYKIAQEYNAEIRNGIARIGAFGSGDIEDQITTSVDWDLKNSFGVPVGSGVYLIRVVVPGVGERVLKSFIINRALDAQKL
jgi:hypothetical protein